MVNVNVECKSYLSLIRFLQNYLVDDEISEIINDLISGKKKEIVISI